MNGAKFSGAAVAMPLEHAPPQLWMAASMQVSSMATVCEAKQTAHEFPSHSGCVFAKQVSSLCEVMDVRDFFE